MITKLLNNKRLIRHYATVGIRREDKSRWERRAALTPNAVKRLIQETGTQVYIQPSTKRIFTNESYEKVKAVVHTQGESLIRNLGGRDGDRGYLESQYYSWYQGGSRICLVK